MMGLEFEIRPSHVAEAHRTGESPAAAARRLAVEKMAAVERHPGELMITADTLVAIGDEILGKPSGPDEALAMLQRLSGRKHEVYTGLALAMDQRMEADVAVTSVWVRELAHRECSEYVATGEPLDKAGAYGIQGLGAALVERIEGEYYNVMGLPVQLLLSLLTRFDIHYAYGRLMSATASEGRIERRS
jgi:septum formation protein